MTRTEELEELVRELGTSEARLKAENAKLRRFINTWAENITFARQAGIILCSNAAMNFVGYARELLKEKP